MKFDDIEGHWVANKDETFEGWQMICREKWKPNVERVHLRKYDNSEFRIVYQNVGPGAESSLAANEWRL